MSLFASSLCKRAGWSFAASIMIAVVGLASSASADVPVFAADCTAIAKAACPRPMAVETPRGLALGTGMRALAISSSALAYSPAGLALGSLYHIEGNIDYMGGYDTVALGGAVTDSSTSKVGAGISLRGFLAGNNGFDGLDGRLGLALPLSEAFMIGLSGRYITLSTHADPTVQLAQGFTMDASLRLIPTPGFQIDVAALNFIDRNSAYVPFMLSGSMAFAVAPSFNLGVDLLADMASFSSPELMLGGGAEYVAAETVPLRLGYAVDFARFVHVLTAGVGYSDQRIGLDFGLRQEVYNGHATRVMAAVRYYVH